MKPLRFVSTLVALAATLAGCAGQPPTPEWQEEASSGIDRVREAYLAGDARNEAAEFARVRDEIARTARPALLARAELVRCALRTASLVVEACPGFEALRTDAEPAEQAYADYLVGRASPAQAPLLPEPHRPLLRADGSASHDLAALDRMKDPLARLVAASVLLQTGRGTPGVVRRAVDTASAQGWTLPLLGWLQVQRRQAEAAGHTAEAARVARRLALARSALEAVDPPGAVRPGVAPAGARPAAAAPGASAPR